MSKMNVTGGEAFPFATLEGLMHKLDSRELLQFAEEAEIDTSLESWLEMLQFISNFLEDAEDKQLTDRAVKSWLSKLRDLVYDAEDIVDVLSTEMLRTSVSDSDIVAGMSSEMKKITKGLEDLEKRIGKLDLKRPTEIKSHESIKEERITTSLLDHGILGREEDKEAILNLLPLSPKTTYRPPSSGFTITGMGGYAKPSKAGLIKDAAESTLANYAADKLLVIPIWGMGGIGKTTLAQLVYNDERVKESFDPICVWLCVSDTFDVLQLTKTILKKVGVDVGDHDKDLSSLQEKLKEKLVGKKFMIVLDDVWSKDRHKWESFCKPLRAAGTASSIIVTCRNVDIALMTGTVSPYSLQKLSEKNCLSLIAQKALKANDFSARPALEPIGKEIASRCQGSPLAAKTLGGLLANKSSPDEWKVVLQSKIWDLREDESRILPALRLSYHHLPSSLKQCFAYLSIFPKDYEFERDALVLLWMAEGFLGQREDRLQLEDLGQQYFDDLVSRSLLLQSANDPSRFVMHDLMHDLAEFVAGEICFRLKDGLPGNKTHKVFEKVRHSSHTRQYREVIRKFDPLYGKMYLRTLLALPRSPYDHSNCIAVKLIVNLLSQFRWLRVLGLSHYRLNELPDSVGGLKHLRYINLSSTYISCLPESICNLHNLQSLILDYCPILSKLPRGMTSLTNLRHLSLIDTESLQEMPPGMGSLKGLQNLSKFIVRREKGLGIQELEHLSDLRGGLSISGLESIVDVQQARRAQLKEKQHLKELRLEFTEDPHDAMHQMLVFETLQPHTSIQAVSISKYAGPEFPSWMGNPLFSKIVSLGLYNCGGCSLLPSLGKLLSLKTLEIHGLHEVRRVGIDFYGDDSSAFPSLETLTFEDMRNWERWHGVGKDTFSCLRELSIRRCPELVEVSAFSLPSLCELELEGCKEVVFRSLRDLNSVTSLTIKNISGLVCLGEDLKEQMTTLERLEMLEVRDCEELKCLWKKGEVHHPNESLAHLTKLVINNCGVFECFGAEEKEDGRLVPCNSPLVRLSALANLGIKGCFMFVNFGGMRFTSLTRLRIRNCQKWESLPETECEGDTCRLEHLKISECPSFIRFPDDTVPKTIKQLFIYGCENLEALPDGIMNNSGGLKELELYGCRSLRHFPQGELPISLKSLQIQNHSALESISERKMITSNNICLEHLYLNDYRYLKALPECTLINLTSLEIYSCDGVESFWEGGFSAPKLKHLSLGLCSNLRCITDQIQSLTSLEDLSISFCSALERFPEAGFPTSLLSLEIRNCVKVKQPISKWGLHKLTSLRGLKIEGVCLDRVCFGDDFVLPSSLTSLQISNFPKLVSLSLSLQNLISLRHLCLRFCPNLRSFPKELLALLPQLSRLEITWCRYLRQAFEKEKGEHWPHISLIPDIDLGLDYDDDVNDEDDDVDEDEDEEEEEEEVDDDNDDGGDGDGN